MHAKMQAVIYLIQTCPVYCFYRHTLVLVLRHPHKVCKIMYTHHNWSEAMSEILRSVSFIYRFSVCAESANKSPKVTLISSYFFKYFFLGGGWKKSAQTAHRWNWVNPGWPTVDAVPGLSWSEAAASRRLNAGEQLVERQHSQARSRRSWRQWMNAGRACMHAVYFQTLGGSHTPCWDHNA